MNTTPILLFTNIIIIYESSMNLEFFTYSVTSKFLQLAPHGTAVEQFMSLLRPCR